MAIYSKVSGVWETVDDPQVKISGVWQDVQNAYVKVAGVWEQVYSRVVVSISNQSLLKNSLSPTDAYTRYQLDSDGKVYKLEGTTASTPSTFVEDWVVPNGDASNYECFATLDSGSLQTGTTGTWLALTSDRMWGVAVTGLGTQSATLTIAIREVGTGTNLTSATISLEATVEP